MATPTYPAIVLRRKGWLTVAIRTFVAEVVQHGRVASAPDDLQPSRPDSARDLPRWAFERMRELGVAWLDTGGPRAGRARRTLLTEIALAVQLIADVAADRRRPSTTGFGLEVATIFALAHGRFGDAELLQALLEATEATQDPLLGDALAKKLRDPMHAIGKLLRRHQLDDDNPLLGGPFHRLLLWQDARHVVDVAWAYYAHGLRPRDRFARLSAHAHVKSQHAVEAIIGLAHADGRVDPMERRLLKELIKVGHFSKDEERLLRYALNHDPPEDEEVAAHLQSLDPWERRALMEQIYVAALIDGEMDPAEEAWIDHLAEAVGLDAQASLALQLEVAARFEAHPELVGGIRLGGVAHRLRRRAQRRAEAIVRDNIQAIITEVRETGDLARLLARATHTELDEAEMARVRAQLLDICKTIPSLALLAAPGGTILIPILIKVVPFSLMPSAFEEQDEAL